VIPLVRFLSIFRDKPTQIDQNSIYKPNIVWCTIRLYESNRKCRVKSEHKWKKKKAKCWIWERTRKWLWVRTLIRIKY